MTVGSLSPETVTNLVQLRALLSSADQASLSSSPITRPMAVVLLDAVNERATHFAATYLSLAIPSKAGFEQLMQIVKDHLGARWTTSTWPDIRRLHRTRNLVQHEGLDVDQKNINTWAAATSSYTRSLVNAVWDTDINETTLAEAVKDPEIRKRLEEAELRLREDLPAESLKKSAKAFALAYKSWRTHYRRRIPFHTKPMRNQIVDEKSFNYLEREISEANEAAIAIAFSGDPGEYVWFRDITSHLEDVQIVTLDEAQRALGFTFGWIIRWEAFQESFIPDRKAVHEQERRHVRSGGEAARVHSVVVSKQGSRFLVELGLADVPPVSEYEAWAAKLASLLNENRSPSDWWRVTHGGAINFWLSGSDVPEGTVEKVSDALHAVDAEIQAQRLTDEESREAKRVEAEAYLNEFEGRKSDFPAWVTKAWLTDGVVIVNRRTESRLRVSLSGDAGAFWRNIVADLPLHELVNSCVFDWGSRAIRVEPQLSVGELAEALRSISAEIERLIAEQREEEGREERNRYSLEAELREAFRL
ncbi:hypothetical protein ACGFOW_28645 [Streptomyces rubiginosohelvolus]|uniref:hypothetical protein n=1 Tax=Streptomyces rubiginosohelvolus TaxID=67362 RepID=UPI0037156EA9